MYLETVSLNNQFQKLLSNQMNQLPIHFLIILINDQLAY